MLVFLHIYSQQIVSNLRDFGLFTVSFLWHLVIVGEHRFYKLRLPLALSFSFISFQFVCLRSIFVICLITERSESKTLYVVIYSTIWCTRNLRLWIESIGNGRITLKRFTVDIIETHFINNYCFLFRHTKS